MLSVVFGVRLAIVGSVHRLRKNLVDCYVIIFDVGSSVSVAGRKQALWNLERVAWRVELWQHPNAEQSSVVN